MWYAKCASHILRKTKTFSLRWPKRSSLYLRYPRNIKCIRLKPNMRRQAYKKKVQQIACCSLSDEQNCTLIKKEILFSSYIKRIHNGAVAKSYLISGLLNPHIWGNICAFPHILRIGNPSSYMTLQLLHSEFPYIWGKFSFSFYQCTVHIFCLNA